MSRRRSRRSKQNDLSRLVYALGIRHVGEKAAATLARHLRTDGRRLSRRRSRHSRPFPTSGRSWRPRFAASPTSRRTARSIARLAAAGVNMTSQQPPPSAGGPPGRFAGQTFVLTGTLASMTPRRGRGSHRAARGQSGERGQPKDDISGRRAPTRGANSRKRRARRQDADGRRVPGDNRSVVTAR